MSSSASPRRSRSHSTTSPTNPSTKRAFSTAASPHQMPYSRGKRARRSSSSSSSHRPSSIIIPAALLPSPFTTISIPAPCASVRTDLARSAPPTPLFPSTSAAFFPPVRTSQQNLPAHSSPSSPRNSRPNLDALHREAFTSLRQSVAESGEGFVRRMREWEQQKRGESRKASMLGNERERRDHHKGRKARVAQRTIGVHSNHGHHAARYQTDLVDKSCVTTRHIEPFGGQNDTDDEDDIMVDGSGQLAFEMDHPRKRRRPVSFGEATMDVSSPELFDVEIADSDGEAYSANRFGSTLEFPSTYSTTRSSSPFSFANTSDDESSYAHTHSGFSSPRGMRHSVDWSTHPLSPPATARVSDTSVHPIPIPSSGPVGHRSLDSPQTASEKAVAAIVLALANGSGSLADYGSVREAQGDLEELEAGALWD